MTIKEYCKETKQAFLYGGELKLAEKMLNDNEELLYASIVNVFNRPIQTGWVPTMLTLKKEYGVLVVTSKRVYFCVKMGSNTKTRELNIKDITSTDNVYGKGLLGGNMGTLRLCGLTEEFVISGQKQFVEKIEEAFKKAKNNIDNTNDVSTNNSNSLNYLEELEKLAELKEKGILTEEEFNNKKQELLNKNN